MYHHFNDEKGHRKVYLNGELVECVIWCDTEEGVVCHAVYPFKYRAGEIVTKQVYGKVEVVFE